MFSLNKWMSPPQVDYKALFLSSYYSYTLQLRNKPEAIFLTNDFKTYFLAIKPQKMLLLYSFYLNFVEP